MSSLPKYQRFIGRLLTRTLVVSLSVSIAFGGYGFSVQSAQAATKEEVDAAKADMKSAEREVKDLEGELKDKNAELKAVDRAMDDGDNTNCNLCSPNCTAGCTEDFYKTLSFYKDDNVMSAVRSGAEDSCSKIYDERGLQTHFTSQA